MTRRFGAVLLVCAAIGMGFATRTLNGQAQTTQAPASPEEFQQTVMPVLSKSCVGCHNDKARTANLSLQGYSAPSAAWAHPEVWQKVLNKLAAGEMPPRNAAPLSDADRAAVTAWIKKVP